MGIFLIYILKSAVCLSLFYLFYRLLLSKETFHRFNRIALLGILFLSLLIPFIEVTTAHQTELSQTVLTVEQLLMMAEAMNPAEVTIAQPEELSISWVQVLLLFYLLGIIFFAFRNLYSLSRLLLLIKSGKRERLEGGIRLIVLEREVAPFSWMRYIVISRKDLEEDGREILIHEMAHIQNRHSIDLLVADICIFFQWFNPGIWLLKQELQNIHEYEADETVINEGIDAKDYQLLLIKKAVGTRLYSMANSFNHSKLKKRITMMLKEKSNPWARLKYLYVLPLAAIAVTAFARPEISEKADEISAVKVNDLAAILEARSEENVVMASADTAKNKVVVVDVGTMPKDSSKEKTPLVIINGKESDRAVVDALDPSRIENISVLKNENAVKIYGEKAKDGAMIIQLKSTEVQMFSNKDVIGANVKMRLDALSSGDKNWGTKFYSATGGKPLVFVDGEEAIGDDPLSSISPDRIKSLSVMKDKSAKEVYGDKGKNGVILVTLLTEEEYQAKQKPASVYVAVNDSVKGRFTQVTSVNQPSLQWTISVDGIVKDVNGNPLHKATVIVAGTDIGVMTDERGRFSMQVPKDAMLQVFYVGKAMAKVKAASEMTVILKEADADTSFVNKDNTIYRINGQEMTFKSFSAVGAHATIEVDKRTGKNIVNIYTEKMKRSTQVD